MPPLSEWQTLFAVQAGAAATLTGLVFVAVSLNLPRIMTIAGLPGRAAESLLQLLQVFFVSTVALIPRQSHTMLAAEILAIALVSWSCQLVSQVRYARSRRGHPLSWLIWRAALSLCATVPFLIAGILLWLGNASALYYLAPGFILSFVASVLSAWVLLVEILR